jgi:hypothetical protein
MTEHRFDAATGHCQRCGSLKGNHGENCPAPENLISLRPYLAKRAWEKGKIIVEAFSPPESA